MLYSLWENRIKKYLIIIFVILIIVVGYYLFYSKSQGNHQLDIKVNGIFDGDTRTACKSKLKDDDPYFVIKPLTIGFYYRGRYSECRIDQPIGTSYNRTLGFRANDKLQGNIKNEHLDCGNTGLFRYRLVPGHQDKLASYSPGFIQIYKQHSQNKDNAIINLYNGSTDFTDYRFINAEMESGGRGYKINSLNYNNEGIINVQGPFDGDPRNLAKLPDDNVYYILSDAAIEFKYKGETHICNLGKTKFGTSFDHLGRHYNKLQSYIPDNPFGSRKFKQTPAQCIGLPGFFYRIIQGTAIGGYKSGYVELMYSTNPREYKDPITWVLYINGIRSLVDDSMNVLLEIERMAPKSDLGNIQYGLLYNRSNGTISDITDLERMKNFDEYIASGKYIDLYNDSTDDKKPVQMTDQYRKKALDWYLAMSYTEKGFDNLKPEMIFGADFDSIWTSFLNYGIYPDNDKIIFVPHSQGNLYANVIYNYLRLKKDYKEENMSVLHVGVVSANTNQNMPDGLNLIFSSLNKLPVYVTGVRDHIINLFRQDHSDILPGNMSVKGEDRINPNRNDLFNHGIVESYLNHKSLLSGFANLLYKFILTDEFMLNQKRNLSANITIYAIRDQPIQEGFGEYYLDPYYAAYYTKESSPNKAEIYAPDGKNILVARNNDVQTFFSEPSDSINGIYLKTVYPGNYVFKVLPGMHYIVQAEKFGSRECGDKSAYILYISEDDSELVCENGKKATFPGVDKFKWNFELGSPD